MASTAIFPVPRRAAIAATISFVLALTVLGLALADTQPGHASLYLNPILATITVTHHLILFAYAIRSFRFSPTPNPDDLERVPDFMARRGQAILLAFMAAGWLGIAIALAVAGDLSAPHIVGADDAFRIANNVLAQSVFGVLESLALSALASICLAASFDTHSDDLEAQNLTAATKSKAKTSFKAPFLPAPPVAMVTVTVTSTSVVEPATPAPVREKPRRKSRPPTWNYLATFASPVRKSFLPPVRNARTRVSKVSTASAAVSPVDAATVA